MVTRDLRLFTPGARTPDQPAHIKDLHTSFSLGAVKASSSLPLDHLHALIPCPQKGRHGAICIPNSSDPAAAVKFWTRGLWFSCHVAPVFIGSLATIL